MIFNGDSLEILKTMPDNSVDSVVTDPPYGLSKEPDIAEVVRHWLNGDKYEHTHKGFMGKSWDSFVPGPEYWREVYRVLKPGGHILVFAGTRTWDLMSIAIRFAGFENRDTIASFGGPSGLAWVQGQGFPKSLDISKAIDKAAGAEREILGYRKGGDYRNALGDGRDQEKRLEWIEKSKNCPVTAPATDAAKQWQGWGTAMKPAWEVVLCFRKPISEKNVAANVLRWGTGGINVDACRVEISESDNSGWSNSNAWNVDSKFTEKGKCTSRVKPQGRFPSNLILGCACESDEHEPECAVRLLDEQSGVSGGDKRKVTKGGVCPAGNGITHGKMGVIPESPRYQDLGGASRFFYCAKASKSERNAGCEGMDFARLEVNRCEENMEQVMSLLRDTLELIPSLNIAVSGEAIMVTCPKECTSIIRMEIRRITELKTWSLSTHSLTKECTRDADLKAMAGISPVKFAENLNGWTIRTGILLDKVGSATADVRLATLKRLSKLKEENAWQTLNSFHPTVKPIRLMNYLAKLITPPNGTVLDPFMGSGTTGLACAMENFKFIGIELSEEYFEIAKNRLGPVYGEAGK